MERLRLYWCTDAGVGHVVQVKGRHLVPSREDGAIVVRIYGKGWRLKRVRSYEHPQWTDFTPSKRRKGK